MNGFLCVNKPQGPSSFQIIDQLRRILKIKKIGHAGTLDPKASGLLIIAIGNATRMLQYLPSEPKTYQFGIQFGSQTNTLDSEGEIVCCGGSIPEKQAVIAILEKYSGTILQTPPAFSAIKINGVRAYKMARSGNEPELEPRSIKIYSIEMSDFDNIRGEAQMQVTCSGGTYVRSIARDIATDLGTYGYASYVHRIGIGAFSLNEAIGVEQFCDAEKYIISLRTVFNKNAIDVTDEQKMEILYGRDLPVFTIDSDQAFAFHNGDLLALLKRINETTFHPATVLDCIAKVNV